MKITNNKVLETAAEIQKLPTLQKSPKAVFALAKNLNRLKTLVADFDETRKALWKEHFDEDTEVPKEDPRIPDFTAAEKSVLNEEVEFEPHLFKEEDLNLEANSISPSALAAIGWLIQDFN